MCTISSAASTRALSFGLPSLRPKTCSTAEHHVLEAGHPGQQAVVLEHHGALRAGAGISRPSQSSTPVVGSVSPAIRLSRVLLPQPEWPISETTSPSRMSRSMSRRATNFPLLVLKVCRRFRS
jgi:hypothetical protein